VQSGEFQVVTLSANVGDAYTGTLPFNSGGGIPNTNGQMIVWTPNADNVGPATLALNGGAARPILTPTGVPTVPGSIKAGIPMALIFNGTSWVQTGAGGAGVNVVTSSDPQMLSVSQPIPGTSLLTQHPNVSNGTVKLDALGKIPPTLLNIEGMILLGIWDAAPGTLPPIGTISGQYYLISPSGILNLFVSNGAGGWVQQMVAVSNGDAIVWVQTGGEPTGWYRLIRNVANTAANIINNATPSFVATDLQSWINSADAATGFLLATGARRATGVQLGGSWIAGGARNIGTNVSFDGVNWRFVDAAGAAWVRQATPTLGYTDSITSTDSTGANNIATLVPVWQSTTTYGALLVNRFGIGGAPRSAPINYNFDMRSAGVQRFVIQDLTSGVAIRLSTDPVGTFFDNFKLNADGSLGGIPSAPFALRLQDSVGAVFNAIRCTSDHLIYLGDNALAVPGAVVSTILALGAINGPLDFGKYQTATVTAGSTVTAITMTTGQVGRILVTTGGAITLPGAVKLPRGGAVYGTVSTVIGLVYDGTAVRASFTPYDT
jgi:hypothetical protein